VFVRQICKSGEFTSQFDGAAITPMWKLVMRESHLIKSAESPADILLFSAWKKELTTIRWCWLPQSHKTTSGWVYAVFSPSTGSFIYVGQTRRHPNQRFEEHYFGWTNSGTLHREITEQFDRGGDPRFWEVVLFRVVGSGSLRTYETRLRKIVNPEIWA
jgi:hypothetical protein